MKTLLRSTALILVLSLSPSAYARDASNPSATTEAKQASYDIRFLDTMTQHHRDGIKMMKLGVSKTESSDIKKMAQQGIDDQTKDIEKQQSLHKSLHPNLSNAVDKDLPGMMPMDKEMEQLEAKSGKEFDRYYLQTMIKHHEGGVKLAEDGQRRAQNAEVKTHAKAIHDKQTKEIAEMQKMLSEMD